jgi:2'-5' RNA ligase
VRLFVAVWPPADLVARLGDLQRPERPGVRWTTPDQWHVTLRFLGHLDDAEGVKAALLGVSELAAATTASAGPETRRLGTSLVCLPVAGLDELAGAVGGLTGGYGEPPSSDRPFRGHLTLARAKRGTSVGGLVGEPLSASWTVDSVTLVASDLHPQGARYHVVARYPLS